MANTGVKHNTIKETRLQTFTKVWVSRLLWCGIAWITLSYVLAFMGKTDIAESLSSNVVTCVIGVMSGYLVKAFLETFAEKREQRLMREVVNGNTVEDKSDTTTEVVG